MQKVIVLFIICSPVFCYAQDTILPFTLQEVVVTASRTARSLAKVNVPFTSIKKQTISLTGSQKLQDVLNEQTGLNIVSSNLTGALAGYPNPFGQGVQLLGLDPAYTAILIDGEPLVGRNGGILKLGRIAIGNINKIEIIKGPASSLYGSEAMGGVINIITEPARKQQVQGQAHAASNQTIGLTMQANLPSKTAQWQIFANRFATQGYDLNPMLYGKTIDPYTDFNTHIKYQTNLNSKWQLLATGRWFNSIQKNNYKIYSNTGEEGIVNGSQKENDASFFNQLKYEGKNKLYIRQFWNLYNNRAFVKNNNGIIYDETNFAHSVYKPEIQYEIDKQNLKWIIGTGALLEKVEASRYNGNQQLQTYYAFAQAEWESNNNKWLASLGTRADKRNDIPASINPRFAMAFRPNKNLKIHANLGSGFKAPDFRHLFLNLNNQQIGYSLIGNNILGNQLKLMQNQGVILSTVNIVPYEDLNNLQPEKTIGYYLGVDYHKENFKVKAGIFRNDIKQLIDVYLLPITKANGGALYSYRNINKVFTQGMEVDGELSITENISIAGGYQFVQAKDKTVIKAIKNKTVYARNATTLQTELVTAKQYIGLPNRSNHSYNIKLQYQKNKWGMYLRYLRKGRFGFADNNGNQIIDNITETIKGYGLINTTIQFAFNNYLQAQAGIENVGNYTNSLALPHLPGRIYFINLNINLTKNKK
jgi:outer membrane receptor for ferrienterochelin and colicins